VLAVETDTEVSWRILVPDTIVDNCSIAWHCPVSALRGVGKR